MTPDESQMLQGLFTRMREMAGNPRDGQAEALINDAVRAQPYAPYLMAQTVLVQQQALENASRRLSELEAQARNAPQPETSFLGSLGKSLFGGGPSAPQSQATRSNYDASAYQRQPGVAQPQAGPWGAPQTARGGGFLSSALTTAAGVAGGMLVANELSSLLGGHSAAFGGSHLGGADQHAQDVQQDADQDQDMAQDAQDTQDAGSSWGGDSGGGDSGGGFDV